MVPKLSVCCLIYRSNATDEAIPGSGSLFTSIHQIMKRFCETVAQICFVEEDELSEGT